MKIKLDKTAHGYRSAVMPYISRRTGNGGPLLPAKILAPIDFSVESKRAILYAVEFARQFGASITLLNVVEPLVYPSDVGYGPVVVQVPNQGAIKKARVRLSALAKKQVDGKLLAETVVVTGSPWFEITEAAKALEIDLIVIGTHGYTGLDHALMGSTAEKVVRHAPCPVLIVRKGTMSLFKHDQVNGRSVFVPNGIL